MRFAAGFIVFSLCAAPAFADGDRPVGSQEPKVTVAATSSLAPQDWDVRVPLTIDPAGGAEVGRVTLRVVFPTKVLKFVELELIDASKTAEVEATAEAVVPPPSADDSALLISVSSPEGSQKPLASGVLLNMIFRTSNLVEPGDWPVKVEGVQAWSAATPSSTVVAEAGPAATITVAPAGLPIFACYFYMH